MSAIARRGVLLCCRGLCNAPLAEGSAVRSTLADRSRSSAQRSTSGTQRRPRRKNDVVDTGLVIAAVGRANVGKSTLFNRLARAGAHVRRTRTESSFSTPFVPSVVDSFPGVTRDSRSAVAAISDLGFTLIDTAGLEDAPLYSEASRNRRSSGRPQIAQWSGPPIMRESMLTVGALDPDELYRALYKGMAESTVRAVEDAHAALFVVDASVGITPIDAAIARWLRYLRHVDDIVLVANKCDTKDAPSGATDALELGFGEPVAISAEHNLGMAEFYQAILKLHEARQGNVFAGNAIDGSAYARSSSEKPSTSGKALDIEDERALASGLALDASLGEDVDDEYIDEDGEILFDPDFVRDPPIEHLVVSIVGRPNVGKSSLVSRLTSTSEPLVGPASGVTRDALLKEWRPKVPSWESLWIVDTAGIRDRSRVLRTRVEVQSVKSSLRALRLSHVAVLVVDANDVLTPQDVRIAQIAVTEGRAIVVVVNKIDCIKSEDELKAMRESLAWQVRTSLNEIAGVEVLEMSALKWSNGDRQEGQLYHAIQRARRRWEKRVSTSALTRYVTRFNETIAIGMSGAKRGRRGTTKFISQRKVRPPMFRLDGSSAVSDAYIKALTNGIRSEFGFEGVPIRIKRPSRRQRK